MRWVFVVTLFLTSCSRENPKTAAPIVHDPPSGMPSKTYEYVLPISKTEISSEHQALVTPWFDRLLSKSPSDVKQILEADWMKFSDKGAVIFRDHLLTLSPKSIVIDGERIWLALHSDSYTIMFHEPRVLSQTDLDWIRKFNTPSLEVFCTHFFDAYEDITPYANAISMALQPISNDSFAKSGDWVNGLYLYYICNGDGIFLSPNGSVGRWVHEIGWDDAPGYNQACAVKPSFESFDQFIAKYIDYTQMSRNEQKETAFW